MNKQMPKNVRKTVGVMLLTGVMALGAFSLLRTGVTFKESQTITTTANNGQGGDNEDGTVDPGSKIGLKVKDELNPINDTDALPIGRDEALAKTPYTFTLENTGTEKQVVRLNLESEVDGIDGGLQPDKINVVIKDASNSDKVIFNKTLKDLNDTIAKGSGDVFIMDGAATRNFKVYAWVDESVTENELFGADGTKVGSISFKFGAKGVQHRNVFDGLDNETANQTELVQKYEAALGK